VVDIHYLRLVSYAKTVFLVLGIVFVSLCSQAQINKKPNTPKPILQDAKVMAQVKVVMDHINGHDFTKSARELATLRRMVPEHPIADLLDGLTDYWQYYPVYADELKAKNYRTKLNACHEKSALMLDADANSIEGTFFSMMTDMMLAKHYSDRGESVTAINYTRKSFGYIKRGFELKAKYVEFYFTTGLYDYFRIAFPEKNPVMRSFMWMFPDGDKVRGLQELEVAFSMSTFTRADAAVFLTRIYLYFENNPVKAVYYSGSISNEYPTNPHYILGYAESLLAAKRYQEALPLIQKLQAMPEEYYTTAGLIMLGWYYELGEKDMAKANFCYVKGTELAKKQKGRLYDNLKGIALIGLARSWHQNLDTKRAYAYYQRAAKLVAYPDLKREAENFRP
jgi:hypothetical protein